MERGRERIGLAAVLGVAACVRLFDLGADVPLRHVSSAAPLEDAFWYLEAAAGVVEGGQPEPTAWDVAGWTQLARVWFRLVGVSWTSAHALGALASWLTVLLAWRWVRACCGARPALVAAAALAVLPPFVVLGRTPLLYGPLTLWLVLLATLTFTRIPLALPVAYAGVLGAVLVSRPPAGALLGGLVALEWRRSRARRRTLFTWLGCAGLGLAIVTTARPDFLAATRYRLALQVGEADPAEWLWRLLRLFGDVAVERSKVVEVGGVPWVTSGSGYGALAAGALVAAALGALVALRGWSHASPRRRDLLVVSLGWIGAFALGVTLMDARPLRYFPLIAPPLVALIGLGLAELDARRDVRVVPAPIGARAAAALVAAWLTSHLGDAALTLLRAGVPTTRAGGLPVLAVLATLGAAGSWLGAWRARPRTRRSLAWVVATLALFPSLPLCLRDVTRGGDLGRAANAAAARVVGEGALVAGPHASYLMLGSGRRRLRAPWLRTQPPEVEPTLDRLIALGVTHLAVGAAQATSADLEASFTQRGADLTRVAVYPTPFGETWLLRLAWAEALGYSLTPSESRGNPSGS